MNKCIPDTAGDRDAEKHAVLIVDDEPMLAQSVARFLERKGYRVGVCSTGEEALAQVEQRRYDTVITDRELPGISGGKLIEQIKGKGLECRIILMSAEYPGEGVEANPLESGAHFLCKPFSLSDLLALLPAP